MKKGYKALISGVIGLTVWTAGSCGTGYYKGFKKFSPKTGIQCELTNDSHPDVITKSATGYNEILINQGDGSYKKLKDVYNERMRKLNKEKTETKNWKKSIESKVKRSFGTVK